MQQIGNTFFEENGDDLYQIGNVFFTGAEEDGGGGGFQVAWAVNSNKIIMAGRA